MERQFEAPRVQGPLEDYAEGFFAELTGLGYSPRSFEAQLRLLRHLSEWLAERELTAHALTSEVVRDFVADRRKVTTNMRSERALAPLLSHLRAAGATPAAAPEFPSTPADALLRRFGEFLASEKGLAPETVRSYVTQSRPFVVQHAGREGGWAALTPRDVDAFIVARAAIQRPGSVQVRANALRALLRWMWREHLVVASLPDAVGHFAAPSSTTISPAAFSEAEVARLLAALPERGPVRQRNEAIIMLLLRLGLRAGEVASLLLEDIGWRDGVLGVRGKRGRFDRMPLPPDVGALLSAYLRDARPVGGGHREVFLGIDAPHRPITRVAVSDVVADIRDRAAIGGPGAAHRLRHTAACSVLASGGGLAEVGQLLRHQHPGASKIYANSNLEVLGQLARPWPTGSSR